MMNYDELKINALDGTITPTDRARLDAYFVAHPDERVAFEQMLAMESWLREAEPVQPPAPVQFTQRVMARARVTPIFRPVQRKQVAAIVVGNSLVMALSWVVFIAAIFGLGMLAAQSPLLQPVLALTRAFATNVTDAFRAMSAAMRILINQPFAWAFLIGFLALIGAWFSVLARVFVPQGYFAGAQR
jgi:anti-sigma factor RsiW